MLYVENKTMSIFHLQPIYVTRILWSMKKHFPTNTPPQAQPSFAKVAECLYRNESSGIYYAFVKRHSKQFRHSLKTSDRQLAMRCLAELREKVTRLSQTKHAGSLPFEELTDRQLETIHPNLKPSSYRRKLSCVKNLKPFFKDVSVRNISASTGTLGSPNAALNSPRAPSTSNAKFST